MTSVEQRLAHLERRLGDLEDERAIRELLARYGYYADACLDDEYVALFHPEGHLDVSMGAESDVYQASTQWHGHDELRRFISNPEGHARPGFYGRSLHAHGHNLVVVVDEDRATATNYSVVLHQDGDVLRTVGVGINVWTFVRAGASWRIASRTRRPLGSQETAELLRRTERG